MAMPLDQYVKASSDIVLLSQAEEVKLVQVIMDVVKSRREELRHEIEEKPKECPEDLRKDFRGISGEIRGLNWILELPQRARQLIKKIE